MSQKFLVVLSRSFEGVQSPTVCYLGASYTYDDFIDELVNQHEIRTQVVLLQTAAEIVNPTHDGLEKFEGHCWKDVPAGRSEHEKELVPFDIGELDALALLNTSLKLERIVIRQINDQTTYKERFLYTFMFLGK